MNKGITYEDLIRYAYHETSVAETAYIAGKIKTNKELQYRYEEVTSMQDILNFVPISSPHPSSVQLVLSSNSNKSTHLEPFY
ncbi:MAG: hypothetical protein ACPG5B_17940 [Chitinophagales bacterium]